jgi:hypothetical protein
MTSRRAFAHALAGSLLAAAAETDRFDVVVYGGVPCGIASAIAAAREGARVLLIERTDHIGGLSTSGINTAESEHMLHWTIGGLALEFYERLGKHYGTGKKEFFFESSVAEGVYQEMLREAGVTVRFGRRAASVDKAAARIRTISLTDGSTVAARVFIDAGYEGDLMARAGVSCTFGRESRTEFGEDLAGVHFDKPRWQAATVDGSGRLLPGISTWASDLKEGAAHRGVMNFNFRLTFAKDPAFRAPIPAPARYDRSRYALLENWLRGETAARKEVKLEDLFDFYLRRNGKYEVNDKHVAIISLGYFGGQFDYPDADYAGRDRIVADHWNYTLGLFHFLTNDDSVPPRLRSEMNSWGLHRGEFADNRHLPYQLYVREARRMRGTFTMTQRDVTADRRKPDAVGISSHCIDSHPVQRVAISRSEFVNEGRIWRLGWAYQIPYSALTPRRAECENLLVPGAASFSHVAFCCYRLESVWMIGGHASGVAAALAAASGRPVQSLDVGQLQSKLRAQRQVIDFAPGRPEKWSDPNGGTGGIPES